MTPSIMLVGHMLPTDADLLRRVCTQQDQQALANLLDRHRQTITSLAYRLGRGSLDPEEVTQELYLLLLDKLPQQSPPHHFKGWLAIVMRNRFIDRQRHQQTRQRYEAWQQTQPDSYDGDFDRQLDTQQFVAQAMHLLNPRERAVVRGIYLEGLSYQEVADRLGYTFKQVTGLMYRAMRRLRTGMAGACRYFQD